MDGNGDHLTLSLQPAPWVVPLHPSRFFTLHVPPKLFTPTCPPGSHSELALSPAGWLAGGHSPFCLFVVSKQLAFVCPQRGVLYVHLPTCLLLRESRKRQKQAPHASSPAGSVALQSHGYVEGDGVCSRAEWMELPPPPPPELA